MAASVEREYDGVEPHGHLLVERPRHELVRHEGASEVHGEIFGAVIVLGGVAGGAETLATAAHEGGVHVVVPTRGVRVAREMGVRERERGGETRDAAQDVAHRSARRGGSCGDVLANDGRRVARVSARARR